MEFGEKNIGSADQAVRALAGALLICGFFFGWFIPLWNYIILDYVALALGIIILLTALFRTCWLYSLLGINTCKMPAKAAAVKKTAAKKKR